MIKKRAVFEKMRIILCLCLSLSLLVSGCNFLDKSSKPAETAIEKSNIDEIKSIRKDFNHYLAELFRSEVTVSTINLHYTLAEPKSYGIEEYPITYGYISPQPDIESTAVLENMKAVLQSYDKSVLSLQQRMTYDILMDFAEREIDSDQLYLYYEILRPSTGTQAELPVLMAEYTFYDEQDVTDYLALLMETPDYFSQIVNFEKAKSEAGLYMSDFAADDVITQCSNFINNPEENYLIDTFNDKLDTLSQISAEQRLIYKEENKSAVLNYVIPAYELLIQGMMELKGSGENDLGLCHFDKGKDYYEYLVRNYTGSDMTIKEMQKQTELQRNKDIKAVANLVNENPELILQCSTYSFTQSEPEQILEELQNKMLEDFPAPPDTSFDIKYVHSSLEEHMAPAFYLTAPIDDISQNSIYINGSSQYEKMKLYTTLAHEGFPGHLYQNVMERSISMPPIRNIINFVGYSEGWATYVEMQSYYYADLDPQLAAVLQNDQSAMLSLYATADMGIHYDGWDLAKTKEFFAKYQITNEVALESIFKLIVEEPGHYLKYYIGYLEFLNLKAYAKEVYQDDYSDYKFNEALMNMGPGPFYILKEYLTSFYKV